MQRASALIKPPTVIPSWSKNWKPVNVCMTIDGIRYFLTPAEALSLADRLVDAAEELERRRVS